MEHRYQGFYIAPHLKGEDPPEDGEVEILSATDGKVTLGGDEWFTSCNLDDDNDFSVIADQAMDALYQNEEDAQADYDECRAADKAERMFED